LPAPFDESERRSPDPALFMNLVGRDSVEP